MIKPTNYPNGVNNVSPSSIFRNLPTFDDSQYIRFFNDFFSFTAADWIATATEGGSSSSSITLADEVGGTLVLTNDNADNDALFLQWAGGSASTTEFVKFRSGKQLWFRGQFALGDATQSDCIMGLMITDTTPLTVTDGVYFKKDDDDAFLDFYVTKDSASTSATAIATLVDATAVTVEFYYDGKSSIEYGVNGVKLGTLPTTNMPDDEELTISFGHQNGSGGTKVMTVGYVQCIQER